MQQGNCHLGRRNNLHSLVHTELVPENNNFQYETRSLPGLALEYEISTKDRKVTYTVSKISFSPVPASKFELPKSGYRIMTYAESKRKN